MKKLWKKVGIGALTFLLLQGAAANAQILPSKVGETSYARKLVTV